MSEASEKPTEIIAGELIPQDAPQRLSQVIRVFEKLKRESLRASDFALIQGRKHIKKSGCSLLAVVCGVSTENRDERVEDLSPGERIYHFTYRASSRDGRFADAVGSASTTEKQYTHPHHDARTLAQTRAYDRAILNLVAAGEVSAEEMLSDVLSEAPSEQRTTALSESPVPQVASHSPAAAEGKPTEIKVGNADKVASANDSGTRKAENVPAENKPSPDLSKQTPTSSIPTEKKPSPIPKEPAWTVPITASQVPPELIKTGVRQYPLLRDLKSFGMVNTLGEETAVVPERPVPIDTPLIGGFLLRKIIEPLVGKHGLSYALKRTSNGLLEAVLIRGKLPDQQVKELVSGARWSFERALKDGKNPK